MSIHAIICTRDSSSVTKTTDNLIRFLVSCKIGVYLLSGAKSIFQAYKGAFEKISPADDDICIFCHDDIEIREKPEIFVSKLTSFCGLAETGFVGPAGTACLSENAIWWDQNQWRQGKHKGRVAHLDDLGREYITDYGPEGDVVALDGLFLAAKAKVIKEVGLGKPDYFTGEWDFYDIHYTTKAFNLGYTNKVMEMNILHNSRGELVGRDSWHKNREAFIANNELPMQLLD